MKRYILPLLGLIVIISAIFILNQTNKKHGTIDNPLHYNLQARVDWETNRLRNPVTGELPQNIKVKELEFAKTLPKANNIFREAQWTHQGPFNVGGRTRGGVLDINNENRIIAGGVSGGIWLSENGGKSWRIITKPDQLHSVTSLVQDTRKGKSHIWYYGTGEPVGNSASGSGAYFAGNGMYKSIDSGLTWTNLKATNSGTLAFDRLWDVIWNIALDISVDTADIVYAATLGAIYKSVDGGDSWNRVLGGNTSNFTYFTNIMITPNGVKYAALSDDGPDAGLWRSLDGDNWTNITPDSFPPDFKRVVFDYNPLNENTIYYLAHTPGYGKLGLGYKGTKDWNSLWKYEYLRGSGADSNCRWTNLSENMPANARMGFDDYNAQGSYNMVVKFKPNDSNVLFIGGTNIYRSTDAFSSSTNTTQIGGYGVGTQRPKWTVYPNHHPDQHVFSFLSSNNDVMINFNDGGVYRTENCMAKNVDWTPLNNGYLTTQCYTINFEEKAGSEVMVVGFQDNGNYFTNSNDVKSNWVMPMNGDGSYSHIAQNLDYYIFSTQLGKIAKINLDKNGNRLGFTRIDPIGAEDYQFINPFVVDPNDENIMYLPAGRKLWRNNQLKSLPYLDNYDSISTGWFMLSDTLDMRNRTFTAISVSKSNPKHRVYLGTSSRYLYRVDNANTGNPAVTRISNTKLSNGFVSCIAIDPRNADNILVVFSNYGIISLVYSNDGGDSWQKVAGNLEKKTDGSGNGPSTRWAEIMYVDNKPVYLVGASTGLYATGYLDDMNTEWVQLGANSIGNVVVEQIKARESDGFIMVGTHGKGIYTTTVTSITDLVGNEPVSKPMALEVYPNPASDIILIKNIKEEGRQIEMYDLKGNLILAERAQHSKHQVNIKALAKGVYLLKVGTEVKRIAIQ